MSTSNERRNKRMRERMKVKIFKDFQERMKGKTNAEVIKELERIRIKYGIEYEQPKEISHNLIIDPVNVDI